MGLSEAGFIDGDALAARFSNPANVEVGHDGTVYVADFDNDAVRAISASGIVTTVVDQDDFARPFGLVVTGDGTLYVQTDQNDLGARDGTTGTIWRVDLGSQTAEVVVRNVGRPRGLAALPDGRIAMSDIVHHTLSVLNLDTGVVVPLAGMADTPGSANGTGTDARFSRPYGLDLAADGALLVADQDNNRIRRVTLAGEVSDWAGTGAAGAQNGAKETATFNKPQDVAVHGNDVFIDDHDSHLIRLIRAGQVSTFAGNGVAGYEDGVGTQASFFGQEGIAVRHNANELWIADGNNGDGGPFNRVRRLRL